MVRFIKSYRFALAALLLSFIMRPDGAFDKEELLLPLERTLTGSLKDSDLRTFTAWSQEHLPISIAPVAPAGTLGALPPLLSPYREALSR